MQPAQGYAPPQKSSGSAIWIIIACVGGGLVILLGILAVLAIFGVRKYIANAKQAEAMNSIGRMSNEAVAAFDAQDDVTAAKVFCASASSPVPASLTSVRGVKYASTPGEWTADVTANAGFACLRFEMSSPQYFQYDYERAGSGTRIGDQFHAIAHGDLDGDGIASSYLQTGSVDPSGSVRLDTSPTITNPGE